MENHHLEHSRTYQVQIGVKDSVNVTGDEGTLNVTFTALSRAPCMDSSVYYVVAPEKCGVSVYFEHQFYILFSLKCNVLILNFNLIPGMLISLKM